MSQDSKSNNASKLHRLTSSAMANRMQKEVKNKKKEIAEFEEEQYFSDLEILQKAHQIIMQRNEENAKKRETGENPDVKAPKTFSNFVNYNSVRDMFNEVNAQLDKTLPRM